MELGSVLGISILILALAGYRAALFSGAGNSTREMQSGLSGIKRCAKALVRPRNAAAISAIIAAVVIFSSTALAQRAVPGEAQGAGPSRQAVTHEPGGEANLRLPDLSQVKFLGVDGHTLLLVGLLICVLGLLFGLVIYQNLRKLPVHRSMREISELIYETCKTYLVTQGKFILILEAFIAVVIVLYFGFLTRPRRHRRQLWRRVVRHPR
jgi:K(+)-stimulated pyrophosphate-energized sodium pump